MFSPLDSERETALLTLMNRTGYNVIQENGQRKFGPMPNWDKLEPPGKGCEIFIGKLPRDCYENELVPVFEKVGRIYELRLMMDFSGTNRGYAFLMYTTPEEARRAIKELNNYEIRPQRRIGVVKSLDNCRLFVGNIPKNKTKSEIIKAMNEITEGVVDAIVYSHCKDKTKNRGFAFVEYASHKEAAMARRKLLPGKTELWGNQIAVDWADPEPEVDEETMSKVKILYIRNVDHVTEDELKKLFSLRNFGLRECRVERVKKVRDFAFIHYYTREDAEFIMDLIKDPRMFYSAHLGHPIPHLLGFEVTWAKPVDKTTKDRKLRSPDYEKLNATQILPRTPILNDPPRFNTPFQPPSRFPPNYGRMNGSNGMNGFPQTPNNSFEKMTMTTPPPPPLSYSPVPGYENPFIHRGCGDMNYQFPMTMGPPPGRFYGCQGTQGLDLFDRFQQLKI